MNEFDLHMHSCYSGDGQFTPEELIGIAKERGLKTIALSDHDCISGVKEMIKLGKEADIEVIPAIECSTSIGYTDVHLLGYGIDLEDTYFQNLLERTQVKSRNAFSTRCDKLRAKYGVEIDEEAVLKEANGKNPWFVMCTHMFNDPRYQDIPDFKDYIPGGKRSDPAPVNFFWDKCQYGSDLFVYVPMPDFVESVQKIHEAGGLAIVAHPFNTFYKNDEMFKVLLDAGVDGIEVYSNYHTPEQNVYYEKLAKEHHLLITCGSDFHGEKKPSIQMGEYGLDKDGSLWLEQFKEKLKAAR